MRYFSFMRPLRAGRGVCRSVPPWRGDGSRRLRLRGISIVLAFGLVALPASTWAHARPSSSRALAAFSPPSIAATAVSGDHARPPESGSESLAFFWEMPKAAAFLGCTMLGMTATGMTAIAMGLTVLASTAGQHARPGQPAPAGAAMSAERGWLAVLALIMVAGALACLRLARPRRASLAEALERAMRRGELQVRYQPIVDLRVGHCVGVEAVLRWPQAVQGEMRSELFRAVAHEGGLAARLTRHLFFLVDRDLRGLDLPPGLYLGLNVAANHLGEVDAIADYEDLLYRLKALAPRLILELTERETLQITPQVLRNLQALRGMGVAFALDDFGTGHSSRAYLEQFTLDYLKIDPGLIAVIGTDAVDAGMLELIIALGARLGVGLVAEGVQTSRQAAYLAAKGVAWGQGALYAGPMSSSALRLWLAGARLHTGD